MFLLLKIILKFFQFEYLINPFLNFFNLIKIYEFYFKQINDPMLFINTIDKSLLSFDSFNC